MSYDLGLGLLTVLGVLAGIGALLYVMTALDPTNVRASEQLRPAGRRPVVPQTADEPHNRQRAA